MKGMTETIKLDGEGITRISNVARELLNEQYVDSRQATAAWLTFENDLLALRDHFGEDTEAQIVSRNVLGRYRLLVKVRGERFDPRDTHKRNDWEYSVFEASGMVPGFLYLGGHNIITLTQAKKPLSSLTRIVLALALGIVVANVGSVLLSQETRAMLLKSVIQPTFDLLIGMLSGLAGPLVFFAMAWGICGIGDAASIGRRGRSLIKSFFGMNAFAAAVAMVTCLLVYGQNKSASSSGSELLVDLYGMIIALIPTNLIQPFIDGNTPQIILLAVAAGVSILVIGEAVDGVRSIVREANAIIQFLMEQLCRLLPAFIVVMMVSQSWSGTMGALLASWFPILLISCTMLVFVVGQLLLVAMRCKVPPVRILRAISPAMVIACITASSSAAFGSMLSICQDDLGIDEEQASFGVPLGMVLCKPMPTIQLIIMMLYCAQAYGVAADTLWYVRMGITCLLYAIAIPPVPGGTLACYGIMLGSLGIPLDAIAVVTALDLLLDNFCSAGNVATVMLGILTAASSLGAVDHERLSKS